jgi:hypothetical protein
MGVCGRGSIGAPLRATFTYFKSGEFVVVLESVHFLLPPILARLGQPRIGFGPGNLFLNRRCLIHNLEPLQGVLRRVFFRGVVWYSLPLKVAKKGRISLTVKTFDSCKGEGQPPM